MKGDYVKYSALLVTFAGLFHLIRSVMGWSIVIEGWALPMWVSWVFVVLIGLLLYNKHK